MKIIFLIARDSIRALLHQRLLLALMLLLSWWRFQRKEVC